MNNFTADRSVLTAQTAAFQAASAERECEDAYLAGRVSERDYLSAMESTALACEYAISLGACRKDLPPH